MNLTAALQASTDRRFLSLEKIVHRMRVLEMADRLRVEIMEHDLCEIVRAEVEREMARWA